MNINNYTPPRSSSNPVLFIIFALVGLGLLAGALFSYQSTAQNISTRSLAIGHVVGFEVHSDSEGDSYVPVVEFASADGQTVRTTSFAGQNVIVSGDYSFGQTVEVYYNPDNPGDMFINDFLHTWFVAALLGGLGLLFLVIDVVVFFFTRAMTRAYGVGQTWQ